MNTFEFAVTYDLGIGVVLFEILEQMDERGSLSRGSGIGSSAIGIEATFVADSDRMLVVVAGMGSYHLLGASLIDLAITSTVVVVAGAFPAFGNVHLVEQLNAYVLVGARSCTMYYKQRYFSHIL